MKRKLNEAFQYVDDTYLNLVESERKKDSRRKNWMKWAVLTACLCIVITAAFPMIGKLRHKGGKEEIAEPEPGYEDSNNPAPNMAESANMPTSDTYSSLEELLAYLSDHDGHADGLKEAGNGAVRVQAEGIIETSDGAQYGDYQYRIGFDDRLEIYDKEELAATLDATPHSLLIWRDRLLLLEEITDTGESELEPAYSVKSGDI